MEINEIDPRYVKRFKRSVNDLNQDPPKFDADEIADYFTEAASIYPDATWDVWTAYATWRGLSDLATSYADKVSYTANASSESLSDISKRYESRAEKAKAVLDQMLVTPDVPVMWGSTSVFPTREEEYPDA